MSSHLSICDRCGAAFPFSDGAKLCPQCVVCGSTMKVSGAKPGEPGAGGEPEIAGHEVHEIIGSGGMGTVRRARQGALQRDVALKIIVPERTEPEDYERFLREARVLAQLDHPNIVPIHDFGRDAQGRCFYTMKLVRGRTLKAIIAAVRDGKETWALERLLEVFRKACDAVAFAHSRGVLHRDLKPENIMVGEFGEVLVMDWGLARELKNPVTQGATAVSRPRALDGDVELTFEGEVIGTPQYMSPEQADARTDLDERCDVYALGGILYTILSLRPPVPKGRFNDVLESVRTGRIEPFVLLPQLMQERIAQWRIPPALAAVVRKAMALDRDARFRSVPELAADVDAHIGGFATSAEEIGPAGHLWLLIKRHRTVSVALLVLLVVSAGFVVQLARSERRATENAHVARQNEAAARKAEGIANENEAAARAALAQARIALADRALAGNDTAQIRAALDAVPTDLRDTNWHYLDSRADERQALLAWKDQSFFVGSTPHPTQPGVFAAATGAATKRVVEFEAKTGKVVRDFTHRGGWVRAIAYSPNGELIALGRIQGGGVSVHRASDGAELRQWDLYWADQLAFMPDGRRLFQGDQASCAMWDATTGERLWRAPVGMTHYILPDAERIVCVDETSLKLISVTDGRELSSASVKKCFPVSSALSPDGERLVVAHFDGQISAFRTADGSLLFDIPAGEDGMISRSVFLPGGKYFITAATLRDSTQSVQLRDAKTGRALRRLRGGVGAIESMCIDARTMDLLVAGTRSATWALPQFREPRWTFENASRIGGFIGSDEFFLAPGRRGMAAVDLRTGGIAWEPSRNVRLLSGTSSDGSIGVVELTRTLPGALEHMCFRSEDGGIREIRTVKRTDSAKVMAVSCDNAHVAIGSDWGAIQVHPVEGNGSSPTLEKMDIGYTFALAWHGSDPRRLVGIFNRFGRRGMAGTQEWVVAWDTSTGKCVAAAQNPTPMNCLATEPGGSRLAEAGEDKLVRIRDAGTLAVLRAFRAHDGPISVIAWHPKKPILATGSADRSVRLWDAETGRMIEELHVGLREPEMLHFSPSGRRLACTATGENTLIWELP